MKTTAHLPRQAPPAHHPTIRLGLIVSALAAVAAVLLRLVSDVTAAAVLVPVVVIGFAVSWHAAGSTDHARRE